MSGHLGGYEFHVRQLAKRLDVRDLRLKPELAEEFKTAPSGASCPHDWSYILGETHLRGPWVVVKGWDGYEVGYWMALHELGHLACGHSESYSDNVLECEAEAWLWAIRQARMPIRGKTLDHFNGPWFASYEGYLPRAKRGEKYQLLRRLYPKP